MFPPIAACLRTSSAVTNIVGNRITRHDSAPQDTTKPYITWFLVAGVPENTLSEVPGIDRCTVQIDCWHHTDAGIESLASAVRDAIEPHAHITAMPINQRETESKLYRLAIQADWFLSRDPLAT
jgi:hypothetical protein